MDEIKIMLQSSNLHLAILSRNKEKESLGVLSDNVINGFKLLRLNCMHTLCSRYYRLAQAITGFDTNLP